MTQKQFDDIYYQLIKQNEKLKFLEENYVQLLRTVQELSRKTLVITSLDNDIEQLKIQVQSLIDEKEA